MRDKVKNSRLRWPNTCTLPKLKISVEICTKSREGHFIEFRREELRKGDCLVHKLSPLPEFLVEHFQWKERLILF